MTTSYLSLYRLKSTSNKIFEAMSDGTLDCFNPYQLSMDNFIIRDIDWHLSFLKPIN